MSLTSDAGTLPASRGRRIVIAVLVLLLILLPLYLWPLRGGLGALPRAATLTGSPPKDPRDAAALASLPRDMWEALLNENLGTAGSGDAHGGRGPRNLTMITRHERGAGPSMPEPGSIELLPGLLNGNEPPTDLRASVGGPAENPAGEGAPSYSPIGGSSAPGESDSWPLAGGGQGNAGPWPDGGGGGPGGGSAGRARSVAISPAGLPFGGDAPSFTVSLVLNVSPGDPVAPHPTPEPGTVALVGLNVLLFCAVAWNHRRYKEVRTRIR